MAPGCPQGSTEPVSILDITVHYFMLILDILDFIKCIDINFTCFLL